MSAVIDKTLAKNLISSYQTQNSATGGPALVTPDGHFLNGFFISRRCLDAILSDTNNIGVSVHFAKHPDHQTATENIFTLVLTGASPNPDYNEENGAAPYLGKYEAWDQLTPCPPYCTDLI
ncbi:hypothetical protein KXD93_27965 [Mucilaginibacter sp. BJC16-A38]|uniref:hypothetical protein n=1 Tax=Mucilaginibacter phenanthrenivorans TaxID=1234842 RepID=UPI002157DAC2|nr:hypothetical protein [Mucilaginibacter phenanthrenivorans]MCR8561523.1 hypothetical protein [Mucilaginibacter phenanthrenivorans]